MEDLQLVYCPPEEANDDKEAPDTGGNNIQELEEKEFVQ